jgi:hypothetical protein
MAFGLPSDKPDAHPMLRGEVNWIDWQVPVGPYKADIVVARYVNPHVNSPLTFRTPMVVVECDGHDFHERTKEQAQHDKTRDREMQSMGFPVLRFTGSEIWRDAWVCAAQIDKFLTGRIDAEFNRLQENA